MNDQHHPAAALARPHFRMRCDTLPVVLSGDEVFRPRMRLSLHRFVAVQRGDDVPAKVEKRLAGHEDANGRPAATVNDDEAFARLAFEHDLTRFDAFRVNGDRVHVALRDGGASVTVCTVFGGASRPDSAAA